MHYKTIKLLDGLTLTLFDGGEAALTLKNNEGNAEHSFYWSEQAQAIFSNFEEARAGDLFRLLYANKWEGFKQDANDTK